MEDRCFIVLAPIAPRVAAAELGRDAGVAAAVHCALGPVICRL